MMCFVRCFLFPNFWGKELLLETFITTLCACFVVCLFRKKTHRLRDVNDDAFKEDEDEDKEEEDTSKSVSIIFLDGRLFG